MTNTIKIPIMFLTLSLIVFSPKISYAWGDEYIHHERTVHHRHSFHSHANPDLTLVSGMDNIDCRVLVDPAPD